MINSFGYTTLRVIIVINHKLHIHEHDTGTFEPNTKKSGDVRFMFRRIIY